MVLLTDKITHVTVDDDCDEAVDIFEDALFTIFQDARNQHGEPGEYVVYKSSSKYGDLKLRLADPNPEDIRCFAHFLWNAGLQAAEMITHTGEFEVKNQTVLELGAGAALPGILCALAGAKEVVLSDYPAPSILENISANVVANIPEPIRPSVTIQGHVWGALDDSLCTSRAGMFSRIIAADCMWMAEQNPNLCKTIRTLLDPDNGVCLAIAGFHTGRQKVVGFFDAVEEVGLEPIKEVFERDIEGNERPWVKDRGFEDPVERKRWLTIAFLRVKKTVTKS